MSYIAESFKRFNQLPASIKQAVGDLEAVNKIRMLEKKYQVGLSLPVIFVSIGDINVDDLPYYLEEREKINEEQAKKISNEVKKIILAPILDELEKMGNEAREDLEDGSAEAFKELQSELNEHKKGKVTFYVGEPAEEEPDAEAELKPEEFKEILTNHVIATINSDIELKKSLNKEAILGLTTGDIDRNSMVKTLLANQEYIGKNSLIADGRPEAPTIENWLKDFMKEKGSGMFDNLTLINYLTTAENPKKLNEKEKETLSSLINLYRNLKFFPESQFDMPIGDWQIFSHEAETSRFMMKTDKVKPADLIPEEDTEFEDIAEAEPEPEPEKTAAQMMLETLEEMKKKHKPGSIERKAIEEEIKKLSAKA